MSLSKIVAMTTVTYHPYSLEDALKGISGAGFQYVELGAIPGVYEHISVDMDDAAVEALLAKLVQYNLKVSGLNANSGLMTRAGVEFSKKAISLAPKLGTKIVINTIAGPSSHQEDIISLFMANIGEVAEHAKEEGVIIGLEVHGKNTGNGRLISDVVREVNHPNVKITYDTANSVFYSDTWPYEDLQVAVPEMVYLHLKDKIGGRGVWNFPPIGMGEVDFQRVFNILEDGGYRGPLSVEIEFDGKGWPAISEVNQAAITAYRNLIQLLEPHW